MVRSNEILVKTDGGLGPKKVVEPEVLSMDNVWKGGNVVVAKGGENKSEPMTDVEKAVGKAEMALEEVMETQKKLVDSWKEADESGDKDKADAIWAQVPEGKKKIAAAKKALNEVRAGKVVEQVVEQKQEEVAQEVTAETKTVGSEIRTVEEIMAGLPDMTEEAVKARDEVYAETREKAYERAPALLRVQKKLAEIEGRPDFAERMEEDPTFKGVHDKLEVARDELLTDDEHVSGLTLFDAYVKDLNDTAKAIKGRKVKKWDIPSLVNQVCDEAVENNRIEVISWKEADGLKKAGGKPLHNNYGENGTICYRGRVDDNYGVVTGATEKVVHAIGWVLSETYKRGPTEKDMKQRRVKAARKVLTEKRKRMEAMCSKIPMSQLLDRDGVPEILDKNEKGVLVPRKIYLLGHYDEYVTKQGHVIPEADFRVRVDKWGQIIPVQAMGQRADAFVEMIRRKVTLEVVDGKIVYRCPSDDRTAKNLGVIFKKMVEAAIYQEELKKDPQKPKVVNEVNTGKVAKKVEIAKKVEEVKETPKKSGADWSDAVDKMGTDCGL